jgi:hypothetical protein
MDYGFKIHDEIFDYSFDNLDSPVDRAIHITEQFTHLDLELDKKINPYDSVTRQTTRHNQYLLNNRSSSLWTKLKEEMIDNIKRYMEL